MTTFSELADNELNKLFGVVEGEGLGDEKLANEVLKKFYKDAVVMKYFLISTGRWGEFSGWLKRFRKSYPNAEKLIEKNLELEVDYEQITSLEKIKE